MQQQWWILDCNVKWKKPDSTIASIMSPLIKRNQNYMNGKQISGPGVRDSMRRSEQEDTVYWSREARHHELSQFYTHAQTHKTLFPPKKWIFVYVNLKTNSQKYQLCKMFSRKKKVIFTEQWELSKVMNTICSWKALSKMIIKCLQRSHSLTPMSTLAGGRRGQARRSLTSGPHEAEGRAQRAGAPRKLPHTEGAWDGILY